MSENQPHDLHTFMAQLTDEISSEYKRIFARSAQDPGTAGDEGEENWASLLREWLPPTYHVQTKGRLIGHDRAMSPQIDIVVLKPSYPRKLLEKKVWLAAGVSAAFECKNTLTAAYVTSAVQRCMDFKALFPSRSGSPRRELQSPLIYGLLAHSHAWKGKTSDPVRNIQRALDDAAPITLHPNAELDLLCVADLATWHRAYIATYDAASAPDNKEYYEKAFGGPIGLMTSMICSANMKDYPEEASRPIGALIGFLLQKMAGEDPAVRDLADYYRMVSLWGTGSGNMRPWPLSFYSRTVRERVLQGDLTNNAEWDDWNIMGL